MSSSPPPFILASICTNSFDSDHLKQDHFSTPKDLRVKGQELPRHYFGYHCCGLVKHVYSFTPRRRKSKCPELPRVRGVWVWRGGGIFRISLWSTARREARIGNSSFSYTANILSSPDPKQKSTLHLLIPRVGRSSLHFHPEYISLSRCLPFNWCVHCT